MPPPKAFRQVIGAGAKETTFGVALLNDATTLVDMFTVKEADFADLEITYRSDDDEINGFIGPTTYQEESRNGSIARKYNASPETIGWALAMMSGVVTSSGTTPNYTHVIKDRSVCTINPPSFAMIEALVCAGSTGTYWGYKGCVIDQITIEVNGKGKVQLTITIKHDGTETAKASFVWPSTFAAVNGLSGAHLTLKCGAAGTEDLTSLVRNFKITRSAGIVEPPSIGGVAVVEYQYGANNPNLEVEFTIKADKSHALYTAMQSGLATGTPTNQILDALLQVNVNRSVRLQCSKGIVNANIKASGNETNLVVKYLAEHNSTDAGAGTFTVKNGQASYLNAA